MTAQPVEQTEAMRLLHHSFDHASVDVIKSMIGDGSVVCVKIAIKHLTDYDCLPCTMAKLKRMTYQRGKASLVAEVLQKLSADICSVGERSICGSTQLLLMMDEASHYKSVFLLKRKSKASNHHQALIPRLNNAHTQSVTVLHSDKGGEFLMRGQYTFCSENGIGKQFTNAYSPEENTVVERANGTLMNKVQALLAMTQLTDMLWGEALLHVVYIEYVTTKKALGKAIPHEALHSLKPDVSHLRTWCVCGVRADSCRVKATQR